MAAADIRDPRTRPQFRLDAVKRGDPAGGEVGGVAGPEEPFGTFEQSMVVLVPADAVPGHERVLDMVNVSEHAC